MNSKDQARDLFFEGLTYLESHNFEKSEQIFSETLKLAPRSVPTLNNLAIAQYEQHKIGDAALTAQKAIEIDPKNIDAYMMLSNCQKDQKRYEEAIKTCQKITAIDPTIAEAHCNIGYALNKMEKYRDAVPNFDRAIALQPQFVDALLNRGNALFHLGRFNEALSAYEKALTLEPDLAEAWIGRGNVFDDLKRYDEALDCFTKAQNFAPELREAQFLRAATLEKIGRYKEAWEQLVPGNRAMFADLQSEFGNLVRRQRSVQSLLGNKPIKALADDARYPISLFILGPSRSGKTTIESLVATLDGVKSGYENPIVENAIGRTFQKAGLPATGHFEELPPELYRQFRDIYLEDLARQAEGAKVFTTTQPGRIFDGAFIATVVPNARFILMKRNLEDLVLRIYQQIYRDGNSYSYDLKAARDYVIWYFEMIDLMVQKLPHSARVVHYEDMVADPSAALRIAAELCGRSMSGQPVPPVSDDRNCAQPYRTFMAEMLTDRS